MSEPLADAGGTVHGPAGADARIVSLVPSITELVCDLGLAGHLVGRTGFCVHPWATVREIPKVGGTKDVRLDRIRELAPTHVIVNVDENTLETADALRELVPHVIVTHPLAPQDNLALYRLLGAIFDREARARALAERFTAAHDRLRRAAAARERQDVLYLIWREPWMTVAPDTYIARTLGLIGWRTLPREPAQRYPQVDLRRYAGAVDRVLLSSEPYHFKDEHLGEVRRLVPGAEVSLIDGEMTSWYGSRAIAALDYLGAYAADGPEGAARVAHAVGEAERAARRLQSPCVGVCQIDEAAELCAGCGRTLDEIARWGAAGTGERREILAAVDARLASQPR